LVVLYREAFSVSERRCCELDKKIWCLVIEE